MQIESREIDSLQPHPRNYRIHSAEQLAILRESLRSHGVQKPVVIRADGTILAGHALVAAARAEGLTELPCHVYDGPPEYAEAFLVADNRLNELGGNDWSALGDLLKALEDDAIEMTATGYTDEALAEFMRRLEATSSERAAVYPIVARFLEHYDYVVIFSTNETDWAYLQTTLQLRDERSEKSTDQVAQSRVITAERFAELWASR